MNNESKMLEQLAEIKEDSKIFEDVIVTALGNGVEIVGIINHSEEDHMIVDEYMKNGYWVVNNFLNGRPLGLGI